MTRKRSILSLVQGLLLLTTGLFVNAQETPSRIPASSWDLRVEIKTDKKVYRTGESVRFRAVLRNSGNSAVYVAKSFLYADAESAGFYVDATQLRGTPCAAWKMASDRFAPPDGRTPEQILREDYLLLPPGGIVGFESQYSDGCVEKHPGTYQMTATYAAQDLNISKVRLLHKADAIITGRFQSEPLTFRVRDR